jgi:ribonuclease P/MRP protein subunit POP7
VEKGIADEMSKREGKGEGEKVYLKATGRAIPRALELGVQFQGEEGEEGEFVVKVEMGNVRAVDDVEVVGDVEEDVPETRMRTVSSVTVSIGMK